MNLRYRHRQALLDELRRQHRAELAPEGLRERLLERAEAEASGSLQGALGFEGLGLREQGLRGQGLRGQGFRSSGFLGLGRWAARAQSRWAVGALALAGIVFALSSAYDDWSELPAAEPVSERPGLALGPEPPNAPAPTPGAGAAAEFDARQSVPHATQHVAGPCPLTQLPRGAVIMPQKFGVPGYGLRTFEQQTISCGPITRRYLELLPRSLPPRASVPVVVVLHAAGESAETRAGRQAPFHFDELAKQTGFILVYANAAPGQGTNVGVANSGSWQTASGASNQVDDEDYLRGIVADLTVRHVIDGDNDVFLVGHGEGAAMVLDAATHRPAAFAGVAAFAPTNRAAVDPGLPRARGRLSRVMLVLDETTAWRGSERMLARRWAAFLGIDQKVVGRSYSFGNSTQPLGSLQQLDVALPATGSAAVRLYVLDGVVERPPGASDAWAFLSGLDGADPRVPDDLPDLPMDPLMADGESVLPDDVDGIAYPSLVFDDEVLAKPAGADRWR